MGVCGSTKSSKVTVHDFSIQNIYNISIKPIESVFELILDLHFDNFKGKNLDSGFYYFIKISIDGANFTSNLETGTKPKFLLSENIRLRKTFESLNDTYLNIVNIIYTAFIQHCF